MSRSSDTLDLPLHQDVPENDGPKIEGYLYKRSSGRVARWQKRYFVLCPPLLTQAPNQEEKDKPSRCVDLRRVHFVREKNPHNPRDGGFEIGYSNRILHLRATTTDSCLHWLRILQSAVAPHQAIGTALAQINEDECDDGDTPQNSRVSTITGNRDSGLRRFSDTFGGYDGYAHSDTGISSSCSSTAASDVDSMFFGHRTIDQLELVDEFVEIPGEKSDVMVVIRDLWKITKDPDNFLKTVSIKFEDWLVVQADRRGKLGLPREVDSDMWEALLIWYIKHKHKHAELERNILTGLEVSFCEDMKERIRGDFNRRLPLHLLSKQALPGTVKKVFCSAAGSTLSSFVTRCETIPYEPARDRFTYALIGVLNFSSQMLRRQFMSVNSSLRNSLWARLPGSKQTRVPIAALAAQVNDCFYFSLVAKRMQAKNQLLPCFEAFEKAFLALVSEACKVWAEHFRTRPGVKTLTQKLWVQLDGPDYFDTLCKDARQFCVDQSELIVPGAYSFLDVQVVRRGLVQPMLRAMMRRSPLNKFTSHFSRPSADCNTVAAKLLKHHVKSIELLFSPSKSNCVEMGVSALKDVRAFLVGDAPVLQQHFIKLHDAYEPDFSLSHGLRLLAWRADLCLKTREEVAYEFRVVSERFDGSCRAGNPKRFMMRLLPRTSGRSSVREPNRSRHRVTTIKRKSTTVIRAGAAGAEKKAKHLMQWARSQATGHGAAA